MLPVAILQNLFGFLARTLKFQFFKINFQFFHFNPFSINRMFDLCNRRPIICNVQQSANEIYKISMKNSKSAIQNGRPDRYWKLKKMMEKRKKTLHTPHPARERHSAVDVSPKLPYGAISLGRHPSYQRNPKMAQKMKKLRSLHSLHVPPSRSKTS